MNSQDSRCLGLHVTADSDNTKIEF
jgi:hypothetical protein